MEVMVWRWWWCGKVRNDDGFSRGAAAMQRELLFGRHQGKTSNEQTTKPPLNIREYPSASVVSVCYRRRRRRARRAAASFSVSSVSLW